MNQHPATKKTRGGGIHFSCSRLYLAKRSSLSFSSASFAAFLAAACAAFFFWSFVGVAVADSSTRCFPVPVVEVRGRDFLGCWEEGEERESAEKRFVDVIVPSGRGLGAEGIMERGRRDVPRETEALSHPLATFSVEPPTTFFGFSHSPTVFRGPSTGIVSASLSDESSGAVVVCSSAERAAAREASFDVSGVGAVSGWAGVSSL